jgi:hypothetical protein
MLHRVEDLGEFILTGIERRRERGKTTKAAASDLPSIPPSSPVGRRAMCRKNMPASYTNNGKEASGKKAAIDEHSAVIPHTRYLQLGQSRDLAADLASQSGCGAL